MNRQQKEAAVVELHDEFQAAEAVYAVDYRGLSVEQMSELRSRLLQHDTKLKVVKNSVTRLAAEKAEVDSIAEHLSGPTALAFVRGDAAASAKILNAYVAESDKLLELKGGLLGANALSKDDVVAIAKLPTREALIGQLVGMIASPITGVARGMNALLSGVAIQLGKIAEQGLIGADAPAPAPAAASDEKDSTDDADAATDEAAAEPAAEETTETTDTAEGDAPEADDSTQE